MDKFEGCLNAGETLFYGPNGVIHPPARDDINIYKVEATKQQWK